MIAIAHTKLSGDLNVGLMVGSVTIEFMRAKVGISYGEGRGLRVHNVFYKAVC